MYFSTMFNQMFQQVPYVMRGTWLKKSMGENVKNIYFSDKWKYDLCYIHVHSHQNYMYDGFI